MVALNAQQANHPNNSSLNAAGILETFFKDFYYELLKGKEQALRTTRLDAEMEVTSEPKASEEAPAQKDEKTGAENPEPANANRHPLLAHALPDVPVHAARAAEAIQERLKKVLTEQTSRVLPFLDQADLLQFKEAQYAMVALADEVFLTLPWSGTKLWQKALLESQLFQSQSAGTQVFQRIDVLLSQYDLSRRSLATIYFQVLALGFRGGLNDASDRTLVKNYEQRLYAFIYGKNPSLNAYALTKLIPECYDSTLLGGGEANLPSLRFWQSLIGALVLGLLFLSYVIWYDTAAGLYASLKTIFEQFPIFLAGQ